MNIVQTLLATMAMLQPREPVDTPAASPDETFHEHLDRCRQCSDHPFALCVTGDRLICKASPDELHQKHAPYPDP